MADSYWEWHMSTFRLRLVKLLLMLVLATVVGVSVSSFYRTNAGQNRVPRLFGAGSFFALEIQATNLGEGKPGEKKEGLFSVVSNSTEMLNFTIEGDCGCFSVEPRLGTIAPKDSARIKVVLKLDTEGVDRSAHLRVTCSNGTDTSNQDVVFTAACPMPVKFNPMHINFGLLPSKNLGQRKLELTIRDKNDQPIASTDLEIASSCSAVVATTRLGGGDRHINKRKCIDWRTSWGTFCHREVS